MFALYFLQEEEIRRQLAAADPPPPADGARPPVADTPGADVGDPNRKKSSSPLPLPSPSTPLPPPPPQQQLPPPPASAKPPPAAEPTRDLGDHSGPSATNGARNSPSAWNGARNDPSARIDAATGVGTGARTSPSARNDPSARNGRSGRNGTSARSFDDLGGDSPPAAKESASPAVITAVEAATAAGAAATAAGAAAAMILRGGGGDADTAAAASAAERRALHRREGSGSSNGRRRQAREADGAVNAVGDGRGVGDESDVSAPPAAAVVGERAEAAAAATPPPIGRFLSAPLGVLSTVRGWATGLGRGSSSVSLAADDADVVTDANADAAAADADAITSLADAAADIAAATAAAAAYAAAARADAAVEAGSDMRGSSKTNGVRPLPGVGTTTGEAGCSSRAAPSGGTGRRRPSAAAEERGVRAERASRSGGIHSGSGSGGSDADNRNAGLRVDLPADHSSASSDRCYDRVSSRGKHVRSSSGGCEESLNGSGASPGKAEGGTRVAWSGEANGKRKPESSPVVTPDGPAATQYFGYAEKPGAGAGEESTDATLAHAMRSSEGGFSSTRGRGRGATAAREAAALDASRSSPARAPGKGFEGNDAAARDREAQCEEKYHATARWREGRASAVRVQEGAGTRRGQPHPRGGERYSDAALDAKPWLASSSRSASTERRTVRGDKPYDPIVYSEGYRGSGIGARKGFESAWATEAFERVATGAGLRSGSSSSHGAYRPKTSESALYESALAGGVTPYLSGASIGVSGGSKAPREEERVRPWSGPSSGSSARYHSRTHLREEHGAVVPDDVSESGRVREAIGNMSLVNGRRGQRSDWKSAYTAAAAPAPALAPAPAYATASARPRATSAGMPEISRYELLFRRPGVGPDSEPDSEPDARAESRAQAAAVSTDSLKSTLSPSRHQREAERCGTSRGSLSRYLREAERSGTGIGSPSRHQRAATRGNSGGGWAMGASSLGASSLSSTERWAADAPSRVQPLTMVGERGSSLSPRKCSLSDFSLHRPSPNAEILRSARRGASARHLMSARSSTGGVMGKSAVDEVGSYVASARRRALARGYSCGGEEDTVSAADSAVHRRQAVATAAAAANSDADWRNAEIGRLRSSASRERSSPPLPLPPPRSFMSKSLRRKVETPSSTTPRRSSTSSAMLPAKLGSAPSVPEAVARGKSTRGGGVGARGAVSTYGNETLSSIRRRDAQARRVSEGVGDAPPPRRARADTSSKFY